jgi:hypothetical protein
MPLSPRDTTNLFVCQVPFLIAANAMVPLMAPSPGEVSQKTGVQWRQPGVADFGTGYQAAEADDLVLQKYVGAYGTELKGLVPRRILSSEVDAHRIEVAAGEDSAGWEPIQASIDVWNLGVGMVTVVYRVRAVTSDWKALLGELDRKREAIREGASTVAIETGEAIGNQLNLSSSAFDPLWMYVVLLIKAPDGATEADLDPLASALSYEGLQAKLVPARSGAVVRVYFNACAAFVQAESEVGVAAARVTGALNAIWAAAVDFDRRLLNHLPTQASQQPATLKQLENKSNELLDLYQRVQGFRTLVGTLPVHLGMLDTPLWDVVAEKWRLESLLNGLGARFDALDHVNTHRVQAVSDRSARRLNIIVLVFTVASLVTFGTAVIAFTQTALTSPQSASLEWLGVLVVFTGVVGLLAWRGVRGLLNSR